MPPQAEKEVGRCLFFSFFLLIFHSIMAVAILDFDCTCIKQLQKGQNKIKGHCLSRELLKNTFVLVHQQSECLSLCVGVCRDVWSESVCRAILFAEQPQTPTQQGRGRGHRGQKQRKMWFGAAVWAFIWFLSQTPDWTTTIAAAVLAKIF